MSSPDSRPPSLTPPETPSSRATEAFRAKSIATRLTDAEYVEVEKAAARAGKKCAEWLRDAALAQARVEDDDHTDPILLAELMSIRTLMLNLFREASKGPISDESLRKMSAYSESIKRQKAEELLAKLQVNPSANVSRKQP